MGGAYTESEAAAVCKQMLLAVNYLHNQDPPIVHRDLKLENWLYASEGSELVKLIDFGIALSLDRSQRRRAFVGTKIYAAPEARSSQYTEKVDLWSFGVTMYTMMTGIPMFEDKMIGRFALGWTWDKAREEAFGREQFKNLTDDAKSFVKALVKIDPATRLSAAQALDHAWITGHNRPSDGAPIDKKMLKSIQNFVCASQLRQACLFMLAWSVNSDEMKELQEMFHKIDKDGSGSISLEEFKTALTSYFEVNCLQVTKLFEKIDQDQSGFIQYSEFLAAAMQDRVRSHEEAVRSTFARFDEDGKGYITVQDLQTHLGSYVGAESTEELFREADLDRTGKVTCDEFVRYLNGEAHASQSTLGSPSSHATESPSSQLERKELFDRTIRKDRVVSFCMIPAPVEGSAASRNLPVWRILGGSEEIDRVPSLNRTRRALRKRGINRADTEPPQSMRATSPGIAPLRTAITEMTVREEDDISSWAFGRSAQS